MAVTPTLKRYSNVVNVLKSFLKGRARQCDQKHIREKVQYLAAGFPWRAITWHGPVLGGGGTSKIFGGGVLLGLYMYTRPLLAPFCNPILDWTPKIPTLS